MTAIVKTTLVCNRKLGPAVDGMETICGRPFDFDGRPEGARHLAREYGWAHTGTHDYCPDHANTRRKAA